ncbi:lysylphosphatidylglycerol synthase domain-containing protein [Rubrivivax gelatinosus]|uniref:Uncharacterized protein n=1 Tax=Rubrivivax gelatinosus TaxID=28068 RepID=A0A4R2ME23_RUBGE|nr:lysylphosphatidylglycerol synthase domain-containing protein [Rubrivivax gelatinosus]MBK1686164.1 hypothetical protein [Rubrivivax gelatinosus]TCP05659.1 hypothetical protein EV684_101531 [Rubrivivax gelatinosus]
MPDEAAPRRARAPSWWPRARRWLGIAFIVVVGALVAKVARSMDWGAAWDALQRVEPGTLALAAALAAASHALYATYDLIGRQLTGHGLAAPRVAAVGFISYAFNLNLGALVGGFALRYKLYGQLGLAPGVVTRVLGYSLLTNWLGYFVLGGTVLLLRPPALPPDWELGRTALRLLGGALLLAAAGYVALCAFARRRSWRLRGHELVLPPLRVALLQLLLSATNWALIAGVCHVLLGRTLPYPDVLTALLLAAVAGVVTHLPAGLGVIEAVFVALLGARLGQGPVLAALLAYRAVYYLAPLAVATTLYFALEARGRQAAPAPSSAR